jgi:signal transduction histidine kinase
MAGAAGTPRAPAPGHRIWPLRLHLVALVVATLLPALSAGLLAAHAGLRHHEADFAHGMIRTAEALALAMDSELRRIEAVLRALAAADELEPGGDLAGFHARRSITARQLGIDLVYIAPGPAYRRLVDTRRPFGVPLGGGVRAGPDGDALRRAAGEGLVQAFGVRRDLYGDWVAGVMMPVIRDDRVIGVLAGLVDPMLFSRRLTEQRLIRNGFATLVDDRGRVVTRSRAPERFIGLTIPDAMLPTHFAGGGPDIAPGMSLDGDRVLLAAAPLAFAPGWRMVVAEPVADHDAAWWRQMLTLLLGGLAALLLAIGAAYLLARRLVHPVAALAECAASAGAEGEAGTLRRIPDARVAEFAALRQALLDAATQLARRREEAEAASVELRAGRTLLQSVIDALPDAVFVTDEAGRYQLLNHAAARLLDGAAARLLDGGAARLPDGGAAGPPGGAGAGAIGHAHEVDLPPDSRARMMARHARVRATGLPERSEEERRLPDGTLRRFETLTVAWSLSGTAGPAGIIDVARDVTEQRRMEAQLLRAESMLTDLVRRVTVSALTSGLAHELNQPLAAANTFAAAARQILEMPEAAPARDADRAARQAQAREALDSAMGQIQRAGEIIRRLRDFMRGQPLTTRPEDPAAVAAEAVRLVHAALPWARGIPLVLEVPEDLPPVPMDRVQVQQVLLNLLRNAFEALQAAPPEAPCVRLGIRLAPAGAAGPAHLDLVVTDNGPGLPAGIADDGFEPLRTNKPEAMGLGLAICREIAQAHGGWLQAGPGPAGQGTCMVLSLPLLPPEPDAPGADHGAY